MYLYQKSVEGYSNFQLLAASFTMLRQSVQAANSMLTNRTMNVNWAVLSEQALHIFNACIFASSGECRKGSGGGETYRDQRNTWAAVKAWQCHSWTQMANPLFEKMKPLTCGLFFSLCIIVFLHFSSNGAAGYSEIFKCPLTSGLPSGGWLKGGCLWALLAACLDISKIKSSPLIHTRVPGGIKFWHLWLTVYLCTSASLCNKMGTFNLTRYNANGTQCLSFLLGSGL